MQTSNQMEAAARLDQIAQDRAMMAKIGWAVSLFGNFFAPGTGTLAYFTWKGIGFAAGLSERDEIEQLMRVVRGESDVLPPPRPDPSEDNSIYYIS